MKTQIAILLLLCLAGAATSRAQVNNARMLSTPNAQTGITYTFVAADTTRVVTFSNASPIAATLPNGATFGFGVGTMLTVVNVGAGTLTITCSSCVIFANGSSSSTLVLTTGQGADIYGGISSPTVNYVAVVGVGTALGINGTLATNQVAFATNTNTIGGSQSNTWTPSGGTGTQLYANTTAATNLANQSSPQLCLQGGVWNGSSSSTDTWCLQSIAQSGTNSPGFLTFIHIGPAAVQPTAVFPYAINTGTTGSFGGQFGMFGATSGFAGWTVAPVAGNPNLVAMPTGNPAASGQVMSAIVGSPTATGWNTIGEYCGATSGATQACAKTVQIPITVRGEVTLNTATTQSITTLPFADATYSCSGSDLTTPAGVVSFSSYATASVTIQETGGANTDHLRWICTGD